MKLCKKLLLLHSFTKIKRSSSTTNQETTEYVESIQP